MAEYTPAYRMMATLTIEHFAAQLNGLEVAHDYATEHDDVLALDELFCKIVALKHRLLRWEQAPEQQARMDTSLKELNRALKWAWLARDEEDHAGGMYAAKLKEAIAILQDLYAYLEAVRRQPAEEVGGPEELVGPQPAEPEPEGMTEAKAAELAATIKARWPQAEVEARVEGGAWVVEARNPRRGTSQIFHVPQEFEQLLAAAQRQQARV